MQDLLFDEWEIELHGHRVIYRIAGAGPPVVLIHGMVNSSRHWEEVARRLAPDYTVVAPDLIGHGDSATPRGDYSLGAHAAVIRDLLAVIGIERATVVGHSLGGGVAMQFFYQFPQRVERLALISSGGLGREVSPLLRGAALPGASALLWAAAHPRVLDALSDAGERMREQRHPCTPRELGDGDDVVGVAVRAEHVRDRDPVGGRALLERALEAVAVDEEAVAADLVRHQVRVREPARMLDSFDDHPRAFKSGSRCGSRPAPPSARSRG
jgi:pimeloyl-ACP methyl ester carboxylesterase